LSNSDSEKFGSAPVGTFSVSVYIIKTINNTPYVLMILRDAEPYPDIWQPVTGRIRDSETAWQTGLREMKEETGLTPDKFYSANYIETFYHIPNNTTNLTPAFVAFVNTNQEIRLSSEHIDFKWITLDEACSMVAFSAQVHAIDHIEKYFINDTPNELLRINL